MNYCINIDQSNIIVNVARKWLNTPFHPQGRLKGIGCDCVGLIVGIASELNIKSKQGGYIQEYDMQDYDYKNDSSVLVHTINLHLEKTNEMTTGDIIIFEFDESHFHLGLLSYISTTRVQLIHSCYTCQKVVEHRMPFKWRKNTHSIYSFIL